MDFILWAAELWDLPTPLCTKDVPLTMSRESNKSMKYQWYDWSQQTIVINFKFAELVPNQGLLFKKGRDKYEKKKKPPIEVSHGAANKVVVVPTRDDICSG